MFVGAVGATAGAVAADVGFELEGAVVAGRPPYCATAAARAGKRKRANGFVNMLKL